MNKADKIKRREGILYKIVKQIPSDNDKWYVKYNRDSDTYHIGKEDEKKLLLRTVVTTKKIKREIREKEKI